MNKCKCGRDKRRRYAACGACWGKLTDSMRRALRNVSNHRDEKDQQTLRQYRTWS
jgi:hypothetical protein